VTSTSRASPSGTCRSGSVNVDFTESVYNVLRNSIHAQICQLIFFCY